MVPTTGASGELDCGRITTLSDNTDVHPSASVTAKLYVPAARPETVVVIPVPLVATVPGLRHYAHVPSEGKPLSTTLPVGTEQVGLVIDPIRGADGDGKIVTEALVLTLHNFLLQQSCKSLYISRWYLYLV